MCDDDVNVEKDSCSEQDGGCGVETIEESDWGEQESEIVNFPLILSSSNDELSSFLSELAESKSKVRKELLQLPFPLFDFYLSLLLFDLYPYVY